MNEGKLCYRFTTKLFQIDVGAVQKGIGTDDAVRGDFSGCSAILTGDLHAVVQNVYGVMTVTLGTLATDLALGAQFVNHVHDDVHDLGIAEHTGSVVTAFRQGGKLLV